MATQVIIVGGGLSGLSAAHTVLQSGGNVCVIDKMSFFGGNSTKATSGINGAGTHTQRKLNIPDTPEIFEEDTKLSAKEGYDAGLVKVLTHQSGPAVEWLIEKFGLDLSLVSRLGGHSHPRTHRGKERFPGMTITYALMERLEEIEKAEPHRAKTIMKARVTKLITEDGKVIGVEYEKNGKTAREYGPVIISTGGFGADFTPNSLLAKYSDEWRGLSAWKDVKTLPNLLDLPTTNGDHCTGDGIKMAVDIGAQLRDMEAIQVHPTGLVDPNEADAKVKFLAAEALRGVGGLILNGKGERFCDDLGKRDYVTGMMWNNPGPFRLVLNSAASKEIEWHCKHYMGRGLMKHYDSGAQLASDMGISTDKLEAEFQRYNSYAKNKNDPWGKRFFPNMPLSTNDSFYVAIITPVVHYTMGGLDINPDAEVKGNGGKPISGLYCAGEAMGGVHGKNRLGGNSLLDCVVYGRVAGSTASRFLLAQSMNALKTGVATNRLATIAGHISPVSIQVDPSNQRVHIDINLAGSGGSSSFTSNNSAPAAETATDAPAEAAEAPKAAPAPANQSFSLEDVAKHKTEKDCWVVVNGDVLNVTEFMHEHPGGKKAILLYAGKDASEEFNMLHKPDVVAKFAPETILGKLA